MQVKSKNELAVTLFKALSLYSFIQALTIIFGRFPYPIDDYDTAVQLRLMLEALTPPLVLVILGIIIWMRADALANTILRDDEKTEVIVPSYNIHVIVFSSIGLYLLCDFISGAAYKIGFSFWSLPPDLVSGDVLLLAVKLVVGLWLLFGSRGIVNLIMKLRREQ